MLHARIHVKNCCKQSQLDVLVQVDRKPKAKSLLQWCIVLITGEPKLNDGIAQVVFIDACQRVAKPLISVKEECWRCFDLKTDHQFLQARNTHVVQGLLLHFMLQNGTDNTFKNSELAVTLLRIPRIVQCQQ